MCLKKALFARHTGPARLRFLHLSSTFFDNPSDLILYTLEHFEIVFRFSLARYQFIFMYLLALALK